MPPSAMVYWAQEVVPPLLLLVSLQLVSAGIFTALIDDLDYGTALYHCFITATTVGYGDGEWQGNSNAPLPSPLTNTVKHWPPASRSPVTACLQCQCQHRARASSLLCTSSSRSRGSPPSSVPSTPSARYGSRNWRGRRSSRARLTRRRSWRWTMMGRASMNSSLSSAC